MIKWNGETNLVGKGLRKLAPIVCGESFNLVYVLWILQVFFVVV